MSILLAYLWIKVNRRVYVFQKTFGYTQYRPMLIKGNRCYEFSWLKWAIQYRHKWVGTLNLYVN
jgi:hypothetical protein